MDVLLTKIDTIGGKFVEKSSRRVAEAEDILKRCAGTQAVFIGIPPAVFQNTVALYTKMLCSYVMVS